MTTLGIPYKASEWPHGLRCMDCSHLFTDGQRYTCRLESIGEGDIDAEDPRDRPTPLCHIICLDCVKA